MTLYYCFNGMFDYEYPIDDEKIIKTIYDVVGIVIECEAVNFYAKIYYEDLLEKYNADAYWCYLSDTKADFIDDKRLARHLQELEAEDEILGVRK